MQRGFGVSELDAQVALELLQPVIGEHESVLLIVRARLSSKKDVDLLAVCDHHIVSLSIKDPTYLPTVWELQDVEGLSEVKLTAIHLRKWDGSLFNVGYLLNRRKDEELLTTVIRDTITSQPKYEEYRQSVASLEVLQTGHKFPDSSGRSIARRLHLFLKAGEVVLFVARFIGSSGVKADAIALTDQQMLLFKLDAFGEAPSATMSYRNLADFTLKKGKLSITDQVGNHVELGRLRYGAQDGEVFSTLLDGQIPSSSAHKNSQSSEHALAPEPELPSLADSPGTTCDVRLESGGAKLIPVIKAFRGYTDLGLKDAKKLVESAPTIILRDISIERGRSIKQELEDLGARVTLEVGESHSVPRDDVMNAQVGSTVVSDSAEVNGNNRAVDLVETKQTSHPKFCSQCGESVASFDQRFCHSCGESLEINPAKAPKARSQLKQRNATAGSDSLLLGEACYERADFVGAKTHFERAAADGSVVAMFNLGVVSNKLGDPSGSRGWYLKAAHLGHVESMFNVGVLLSDSGEVAEGVRWYEEAAKLGHVSAAYNLGLYFDQDMGDTRTAEFWFERAARDGDPDALFMLASILKENGDIEGAKARYLLASEAGKIEATHNLGLILREEGDQDGAVKTLMLAAERGSTSAMTLLGADYRENGDLATAQVWLTRSAEAGDADGMYELAQLMLQIGPDDGGWLRRASDAGDLRARALLAVVSPNAGTGRRIIRD